jgi:hypothetical protein
MDERSLLDSVLPLIDRHLETLWFSVRQPLAFYARGSATMQLTGQTQEPWDMDFMLFVASERTTAACAAAATMSKILQDFPNLPHPDISVVLADRSCPQNLHALLLLSESGRLLFGEDIRPSPTFFVEHRHAIRQYAQEASAARLKAFESCQDREEQDKRAPHLAKSVLRLGGLLRLGQQFFSRNPEECASWLKTISLNSSDSVTLLLRSLATGVEPTDLANGCRQILTDANRAFLHDMQRD